MPAIEFTLNRKRQRVDVSPQMPLLWVLRDTLGLTGTKFGCGCAALCFCKSDEISLEASDSEDLPAAANQRCCGNPDPIQRPVAFIFQYEESADRRQGRLAALKRERWTLH